MPEPLKNAEPVTPTPNNDEEAWRRQRPKLAYAAKPIEVTKPESVADVEIPNPQLGEFDIIIETLVRIKGREKLITEEVSSNIIRQALNPASRGAFMTAVDRAFAAAADNVKINFSAQLKEPIVAPDVVAGQKPNLAGGNDRRTLDPSDIPSVLIPTLPPPQVDDFPSALPPKPIAPKP